MITNDAGRKIIMDSEGLYLTSYKCPAGIWTIGWGHTGDVQPGMKITKHQAEVILEHDLQRFEEMVDNAVMVPLNANQFSALVSFAFNVGPGAKDKKDGFVMLKSGKPSSLLRKLNASAYLSAAEEFNKWVHGGGKILPGLVKRRAAERALFLTPVS